jgi:integrase
MNESSTTPAITITTGKGATPQPYYEAVWNERRDDGGWKPAKQRIGKAWLVQDGEDERGRPRWVKKRGRVPDGFFDERRANAAAPDAVEAWRVRDRQRRSERVQPMLHETADRVTVRTLAHEWLAHLRDVRGASPSTVQDYGFLLREPGERPRRGVTPAAGRLMRAFGDVRAVDVTPRDVSKWLVRLDREGLTPRNVNKHRQILHSVFTYGTRADTYGLPNNPVAETDRRRELPPQKLDYYEPDEVEALAVAAAKGPHRIAPSYKGRVNDLSDEELRLREQQDAQDGELFRVLLYSGLRIGEARALRWENVLLTDDLQGGVLDVQTAVSANVEKPPKSWRPRTVPIPRPAAEALDRLRQRPHFVAPNDYVFCNRRGGRLDTSSIRRRYKAAREDAGLREVKLHGLRHAAGSIVAQGAGLLVARDVLGHAHVSTTNRYLQGKTDSRAIAVMNAAYGVPIEDGE